MVYLLHLILFSCMFILLCMFPASGLQKEAPAGEPRGHRARHPVQPGRGAASAPVQMPAVRGRVYITRGVYRPRADAPPRDRPTPCRECHPGVHCPATAPRRAACRKQPPADVSCKSIQHQTCADLIADLITGPAAGLQQETDA